MLTTAYLGLPLTWQRITPANNTTYVSEYVYKYQEHKLTFADGNNGAIPAAGSILCGNNSAATGIVVSVGDLTSGTWADNNAAGYMIVKSSAGTWEANESINIAGTFCCNMTDTPALYQGGSKYRGFTAKTIVLVAEGNAARVGFDGQVKMSIDQTANLGFPLAANSTLTLNDQSVFPNICVVNCVGTGATSVTVIGYF